MAKSKEELVRVRFRRTITLVDADGETRVHNANAHEAVPVSDEVWAAINRGDADMEPGPGVDGQPFPPEELTAAPVPTGTPTVAGPTGPGGAPAAPGTAKAGAPVDYDSWTAEELHQEATKRELEGRSGLDKAGLAKALAKDDKAKKK